jgi:protein-L-isoaspartate(D-aspartate) O-methyltransferase
MIQMGINGFLSFTTLFSIVGDEFRSFPAKNYDVVQQEGQFRDERNQMVEEQLVARGIRSKKVLEAMRKVPRHEFVPREQAANAYQDSPLPIGEGQTISQPFIVAYMTELLDVQPTDRVLEIGTGSGYQAAVVAELAKNIYSIEIICVLADRAREVLAAQNYKNITIKCGDGYRGWQDFAPFDKIIITAAPREVPKPLVEQLKVGGKLVAPVGDFWQQLVVIEKTATGVIERTSIPVRFVPMKGEAGK